MRVMRVMKVMSLGGWIIGWGVGGTLTVRTASTHHTTAPASQTVSYKSVGQSYIRTVVQSYSRTALKLHSNLPSWTAEAQIEKPWISAGKAGIIRVILPSRPISLSSAHPYDKGYKHLTQKLSLLCSGRRSGETRWQDQVLRGQSRALEADSLCYCCHQYFCSTLSTLLTPLNSASHSLSRTRSNVTQHTAAGPVHSSS